jgi:protein AroM
MSAARPRIGMVTIGQAPRADIVPDMTALLGDGVEILERGALDALGRDEIAALAPAPGDEILVTRLADGSSVFVAQRHIVPRLEAKVAELEAAGASLNIVLCTGAFPRFTARRPLLEPWPLLLGTLRALTLPGRLGVVPPSARHVPQTETRWRAEGFDPCVVPLSPYDEQDPAVVAGAAAALRAREAGLVVLDCIGFRRKTQRELAALTGVPVVLANLLVARVAAELVSAR